MPNWGSQSLMSSEGLNLPSPIDLKVDVSVALQRFLVASLKQLKDRIDSNLLEIIESYFEYIKKYELKVNIALLENILQNIVAQHGKELDEGYSLEKLEELKMLAELILPLKMPRCKIELENKVFTLIQKHISMFNQENSEELSEDERHFKNELLELAAHLGFRIDDYK